jgi:hypothetical protein
MMIFLFMGMNRSLYNVPSHSEFVEETLFNAYHAIIGSTARLLQGSSNQCLLELRSC